MTSKTHTYIYIYTHTHTYIHTYRWGGILFFKLVENSTLSNQFIFLYSSHFLDWWEEEHDDQNDVHLFCSQASV